MEFFFQNISFYFIIFLLTLNIKSIGQTFSRTISLGQFQILLFFNLTWRFGIGKVLGTYLACHKARWFFGRDRINRGF